MEFKNITIIKKANVYYGGKVNSRNILFSDGSKKTLGFVAPGKYEFSTATEETMEILGGSMDVMQKDDVDYTTYYAGQSFVVPANSSFKIKVEDYADYCCSY